jgi:hypothetical protein
VTREQENRDAGASINCDTAQQRSGLAVPAILAWDGHHPVAASPVRNKRGNRGGDTDSDSKAERKLEQVVRDQERH